MSKSILDSIDSIIPVSEVTVIGDTAIETEIVLTAIREECVDDAEFASLLGATALEMGLYDVLDGEVALEVSKKIVIEDYKAVKFDRVAKRTAIRMAQKANDMDYQKYKKYRDLMIEHRENVYRKYLSKAKSETRKILSNAKRSSSNMSSNSSKGVVGKIDRQIASAKSTMNKSKP